MNPDRPSSVPPEEREREYVMAIPTEQVEFSGFRMHGDQGDEIDLMNSFDGAEYRDRTVVEQDTSMKQPISYGVILDSASRRFFVYKRAKKGTEGRLEGLLSIGLGGHVEKGSDDTSTNPIVHSLLREVSEEVDIEGKVTPKLVGYVNEDESNVGKHHIGVVFTIKGENVEAVIKEEKLKQGRMVSIDDLEDILASEGGTLEPWSRILFEEIKQGNFS